jgi:FtsH-binding integral membrane protein
MVLHAREQSTLFYNDIINMFIYILKILGDDRERS